MTKFTDLGLAEPILKALSAEGYTHPTPIQTAAIPTLLQGRDIVGIAQTGTGKTAAFVLPLLHKLAAPRPRTAPKTCQALIITPTRELAAQIVQNIQSYGQFGRTTVALIVGGVRPQSQLRKLTAGPDIIVATPGRLLDHLNTGALSLGETTSLVIDEADQMLDLGFLPGIRAIVRQLPQQRQTALLSATMPKQIRKLADDLLENPAEISVDVVSKPVERIDQSVRHVAKADKRHALTEILNQQGVERTVVFARTKHGADRICKHLRAANLNAGAIHGNKSQNQRERTMNAFRSGETAILVATDIAARGIDIDDISHVVNFDLPNVAEVYVHRIGRTARAGRSGTAITLCDPSEKGLLKDIEKLIGSRLPSSGQPALGSAQADAPTQESDTTDTAAVKPPAKRRRHKRRPAKNKTNNNSNATPGPHRNKPRGNPGAGNKAGRRRARAHTAA